MKRYLANLIPAATFWAYILMAIFTFGHATNRFCEGRNDGCKVGMMIFLITPTTAAFWPLYWSVQLTKR